MCVCSDIVHFYKLLGDANHLVRRGALGLSNGVVGVLEDFLQKSGHQKPKIQLPRYQGFNYANVCVAILRVKVFMVFGMFPE